MCILTHMFSRYYAGTDTHTSAHTRKHTHKYAVMGQCVVYIFFDAVDTPCCSPYYSVHIKQVVLGRKRDMMTRLWLTIQLILMPGFLFK